MTVTKRTRFEVLRRDDFTCRYCRSRDNELTIDHVVPVSLGGSDAPDNLVAACRDCNAGKASSGPDEETVASVGDDAVRWANAIQAAAAYLSQETDVIRRTEQAFVDAWEDRQDRWSRALPENWRQTVGQLLKAGLSELLLIESVHIAFDAQALVTAEDGES